MDARPTFCCFFILLPSFDIHFDFISSSSTLYLTIRQYDPYIIAILTKMRQCLIK